MTKQEELKYPRVMMVSNNEIDWKRRVVFMDKNKTYLAWSNATTFAEARKITAVSHWEYAKEIEEPKTIELTMKQIADKFGCEVEQLKIKF